MVLWIFFPLTLLYHNRGVPLLYLKLLRTRTDKLSPSLPVLLCGCGFVLPSSREMLLLWSCELSPAYMVQPFCLLPSVCPYCRLCDTTAVIPATLLFLSVTRVD